MVACCVNPSRHEQVKPLNRDLQPGGDRHYVLASFWLPDGWFDLSFLALLSSDCLYIHLYIHDMSWTSSYRGWPVYRIFGICAVFILLILLFYSLAPESSPGRDAVNKFSTSSKSIPRDDAANATLGVSGLTDKLSGRPEIDSY